MRFEIILDYGEVGGEVLFHPDERTFFRVSRILLRHIRKRIRRGELRLEDG